MLSVPRVLLRRRPMLATFAGGSLTACQDQLAHTATRAFSSAPFARHKDDRRKQTRRGKQERRGPSAPTDSGEATSSSTANSLIRLSKRMSELDICSRREADRFIMEGRVMLKGQSVEPVLGQKVPPNESDIVLLKNPAGKNPSAEEAEVLARPMEFSWDKLQTAAVVLHKPIGFVSGQPEGPIAANTESYIPAVRLLTPSNAHILRSIYQNNQEYQEAKTLVKDRLGFALHHHYAEDATLQNYVPAGRLDLESSGLLIFTNQGVLAKKLVSDQGQLEKEYWVVLEPIQGLTREEQTKGMKVLPTPNRNLRKFRSGGFTLFGDTRPIRPVVAAEWMRWEDQQYVPESALEANARRRLLRIVLKEGRKHQIRRMCREILGMHVAHLVRTRVGSIELNHSLPEGRWRPLRRQEVESIYFA